MSSTAATSKGRRAEREPLTRSRAVVAAVEVADGEGLAAVSMRRLAQELGVEAMSLYHHVANKDDILDGMVDQVFSEIPLPALGGPWRPAMAERAHALRAAMLRHRWAISVMESRSRPGPHTIAHHDRVLGCLMTSGFSSANAGHAYSLLDAYIYGFVMQEVNLPFDEGDDLAAVIDAMVPPDFAETYPYLARQTTEVVLQPGYSFSAEFDVGLELILDALDARPRS
jgi:AcrR family transcriptional regulator